MTGQNREEDFFGQEIREENDLREGADLTADSKKTMKTAGEASAGAKQKKSADIGAEAQRRRGFRGAQEDSRCHAGSERDA